MIGALALVVTVMYCRAKYVAAKIAELYICCTCVVSEQYRSAPFTPFSVTLGYMIKEIHRCLMLALTTEQSPITTTQIIKVRSTAA